MSDITPAALKALILELPENSPVRSAFLSGQDVACSDAFKVAKIRYGDPVPVLLTELGLFLANIGVLSSIYDISNTAGVHTPARNVALLVRLLLGSGTERPVNPNDPAIQGMMSALKLADIITSEHEAMWLAYCRPYLMPSAEQVESARRVS